MNRVEQQMRYSAEIHDLWGNKFSKLLWHISIIKIYHCHHHNVPLELYNAISKFLIPRKTILFAYEYFLHCFIYCIDRGSIKYLHDKCIGCGLIPL